MASLSEDHCSVSPKRMKLEDTDLECKTNSEPCLNSFGMSHEVAEQPVGENEQPFLMEPDFLIEDQTGKETPEFESPDNEEEEGDADDDDEVSSTISSVSNWSGLSEMSGHQWKPIENVIGLMRIEKLMLKGISPRDVFSQITGDSTPVPDTVSDMALWKIIATYLTESPRRTRLPNISTFDDVVNLLRTCKKIIVLTGAGVSVSCGIPDFRSKDGVYARLAVDFPDLPDPQSMFDINYFRQDPRPFFKFACEIYPGQFKPSPCHRFIKMLERQKKLLRNYTQNIDTLEKVAGIENVVECHGSFATATCTRCGHTVTSEEIREVIFKQQIPVCPKCSVTATTESEKGVMKPDIVFFGEGLPESFHDAMGKDKDECDLLIVIGSSLKVRPVALIPCSLPSQVPQVLINRERLPHLNFDVELLGDSDIIIDHLCQQLGDEWKEICWRDNPLRDCSNLYPIPDSKLEIIYSSSDEQSDNESSEPVEVKCQRIGRRIGDEDSSRHMSLDSSRDSGIGESSNSSNERSPSPTSQAEIFHPQDSYYQIKKRRYIFPGAEVFQQHRCEASTD